MKYLQINNKLEAAAHFNELSETLSMGTTYRVLENENNHNVITNVPTEIYENPNLKKYLPPPVQTKENNENFISFLHDSFNFFHNNYPDAHLKYNDGKLFHYNNCYDNSLSVYFLLKHLNENNGLPLTAPACISLGYISNKLIPGGVIGNAVVNMENLVVHDWHIWNSVNNFIIDLSLTKQGGAYDLATKKIQWNKAENHVFKYPPKNITYRGINFTNHEEFARFTMEIFPNHSTQ